MSKGSDQRPKQVDNKTFEDNWNKVFGKRKEKKDTKKKENRKNER